MRGPEQLIVDKSLNVSSKTTLQTLILRAFYYLSAKNDNY